MRLAVAEEAAARAVVGEGGGPDDPGHAVGYGPGSHGFGSGPGGGLRRLATTIGAAIGGQIAAHAGDPAGALLAIVDAIEADLRRPGFRGCPFNNASIEFDDPQHPARVEARAYRQQLHALLTQLAARLAGDDGEALASQLAVLVDGAYTNAAHLGPDGPAATGLDLARHLIRPEGPGVRITGARPGTA